MLPRLLSRLPEMGPGEPPANLRDVLDFMGEIGRCGALRTRAESAAATTLVRRLGLLSHHDPQKNWDTLKCLYYALRHAAPEEAILDAGSGRGSVILRWLGLLGFSNLHACDLRPGAPAPAGRARIHFSVQDLSSTAYADAFFRAITCISVIEHGVDLERFAREMSRILKPGGLLLISTDYWSEPIDCRGIFPYGPSLPEMKVFQPRELQEFCTLADRYGLSLCAPLDLTTQERAVRWERVDREYTFAFLALRKAGEDLVPESRPAPGGRRSRAQPARKATSRAPQNRSRQRA